MIPLKDFFNITETDFKRNWTACLNNDIKEDVCTLLDSNEKPERKARLEEHISWCRNAGKSRFRVLSDKSMHFLRVKGYSDRWLFLGAFDRVGTNVRPNGDEVYELKRSSDFDVYAERLVVKYTKTKGPKQAVLSWKKFCTVEVVELLPDIYSKTINPFPGYDDIKLDFTEMVRVFKTPYENWKEALSCINGIYVIADKSNGKLYVGSTYGHEGVWQRWMSYVETNGHGGDEDLKPLINNDPNYAINHFQFTLVEYFFNIKKGKNDKQIIKRESYWKETLLTRQPWGYNHN